MWKQKARVTSNCLPSDGATRGIGGELSIEAFILVQQQTEDTGWKFGASRTSRDVIAVQERAERAR